jgi:hypothetical protein
MLPYRRLAPAFKSCLFSVSRPITSSVPCRAKLSSPTTLDTEVEGHDAERENNDIMNQRGTSTSGPDSYRQFLDEIGLKYKFASPQLWLGRNVVEFVS